MGKSSKRKQQAKPFVHRKGTSIGSASTTTGGGGSADNKTRTKTKHMKTMTTKKEKLNVERKSDDTRTSSISNNQLLSVSSSSSSSVSNNYPVPFPTSFKYPTNDFLRNIPPYKESFEVALQTSYEGFVIDEKVFDTTTNNNDDNHDDDNNDNNHHHNDKEYEIQQYLHQQLDQERHIFRIDVTQPFGLGTKCAKTYVTRCLFGQVGTTYKYLGLRMFAHPWEGTMIQQLCHTLQDKTKQHLHALDMKRKKSRNNNNNTECCKGRSVFDICLINRMDATKNELKMEPTIGNAKTTVSWHADSSLEHYSTIAVYQTLVPIENDDTNGSMKKKEKTKKGSQKKMMKKQQQRQQQQQQQQQDDDGKWHVALRVAHDSEGPNASKRGTDIRSSIITETPPIAVSLPSGSAYYLLDDFNHHHQHTVITDGDATTAGIRYSCTYRLLRESHTVQYMLQRCKSTCQGFHKKGIKVWRSEQLVLSEIETEWIRQFYIQGIQHHNLLWSSWKEPIEMLLKYWSQLELRTKQTIDFLIAAAEGRCTNQERTSTSSIQSSMLTTSTSTAAAAPPPPPPPSRAERKLRERRKKAMIALEGLIERGKDGEGNMGKDAAEIFYEPVADLIQQRAEMRSKWREREKDSVFYDMPRDCRPMPIPFKFINHQAEEDVETSNDTSTVVGTSPLPGSSSELEKIASELRLYGKAFVTGDLTDLPKPLSTQHSTKGDNNKNNNTIACNNVPDSHKMTLDWFGWSKYQFGLELQEPWAGKVIDGTKKIETRSYDLPKALLGKRIMIIQSPTGLPGISAMGDSIEIGQGGKDDNNNNDRTGTAKIIGWCIFSSVKQYTTKEQFESDESRHLVSSDSGYAWKDDGPIKIIYGWVVEKYGKVAETQRNGPQKHEQRQQIAVRRMRSLFQLEMKHREKQENHDHRISNDNNKNGTDKRDTTSSIGKEKKKKKRRKRY